MPRYSPTTEPVAPPPSLVASAVRVRPTRNQKTRPQAASAWQAEAWRHFDICGELRYGSNWFANALSRARLFVGRRQKDGSITPITSGAAFTAMTELFADAESQASLLKAMGQHFFVAGEWYLVGRDERDGKGNRIRGSEMWEVVSSQEVSWKRNRYIIDYGDGVKIELDEDEVAIRMWMPHPRRKSEPDSPVRAVLPVLNEIEMLTRHIAAQTRSRLAGAGVFAVPSEVQFSPPPGQGSADATGNSATGFLSTLVDAMEASLADPGDPSALAPIVITLPGEHIGHLRHITFWSDLDQQAAEQRESAMKRLALGLDLPPEVLSGTGDVNHWGAWQIEESTIKAHIEPALEMICAALTQGYLREALDGSDSDVVFGYDTTALRLRPNRSKEALELYDRGELKADTLRKETGFDSQDEPDKNERQQWLLQKVASGSATPEQVEAALRILGVNIVTDSAGPTREARPAPSLEDHPTNEPPEPLPPELAAALDVTVMRAMERVGNRIKTKFKANPPGVPAVDLYRFVQPSPEQFGTLLDDAFSLLPRVLAQHGITDCERYERCLDAYCRSLLLSQSQHTMEGMLQFVRMGVGTRSH